MGLIMCRMDRVTDTGGGISEELDDPRFILIIVVANLIFSTHFSFIIFGRMYE